MRKVLFLFLVFASVSVAQEQVFQNVTNANGISGMTGLGHSVGWGDIDNDDCPELAIGNQSGSGYWFFHNDNGDTFTNITTSAGLGGMSANKTIFADFTGDGYNDLLLRRYMENCTLFENDGDGTFTNITGSSALPDSGAYNLADFDNDGNLDVLTMDIQQSGDISVVYGNGDGTFQPPVQIGVVWGYTPLAAFDYDRDGDMDVFWIYDGAHPTTLLRNNGDGTFTNVTSSSGIVYSASTSSLDVGDIDNDGWIDIFIGGQNGKLYLNDGDGTFTDITGSSGISGHADSDRTATFNDFNNDGWLDIFTSWHLDPNQLWENDGSCFFQDVADQLGLSPSGFADFFGVGWADFNMDCAIDFFGAGHFSWVLFENQNCTGNALFIILEGTVSNYNGIGAQVDLWTGGQMISRNMLADPGIQDFSHLELHFGMGTASVADSIIVYWPSGLVQNLYNIASGQHITVVEGSTGIAEGEGIAPFPGPSLDLPNPVRSSCVLTASGTGSCCLEVYDVSGRMVQELFTGTFNGSMDVVWDASSLDPGVYFVHLEDSHGVTVARVSVVCQ
ncbi:MAG: VCBS repeat-containing protein [Candidatus Sabulitectum sp.]|nr:VCBS repeat-containing protein [Candidatus Sabulitectum sp.]